MLDAVVDLSHDNPSPDFAALAAGGACLGVIHKLSQGVGFVDPTYAERRLAAKAAGLLWGGYHFLTGDASGEAQADFCLNAMPRAPGELLALDFELNPDGPSATMQIASDFATAIEQTLLAWPVLYVGGYFKDLLAAGQSPTPALLGCPLWLSEYGPTPRLPAGFGAWSLWQYSDGTIDAPPPAPGVGACDRDRFNGDAAALGSWWAARAPAPAAP